MANSKSTGAFKRYATVDTAPDELGYFTDALDLREIRKSKGENRVYFSIREYEADSSGGSDTSEITITLQFKCEGDLGWQDYVPLDGSALAVGNRVILEDSGAAVLWRAGVKWYNYGGGIITFGFDW